jgi:hypothetical protein
MDLTKHKKILPKYFPDTGCMYLHEVGQARYITS